MGLGAQDKHTALSHSTCPRPGAPSPPTSSCLWSCCQLWGAGYLRGTCHRVCWTEGEGVALTCCSMGSLCQRRKPVVALFTWSRRWGQGHMASSLCWQLLPSSALPGWLPRSPSPAEPPGPAQSDPQPLCSHTAHTGTQPHSPFSPLTCLTFSLCCWLSTGQSLCRGRSPLPLQSPLCG